MNPAACSGRLPAPASRRPTHARPRPPPGRLRPTAEPLDVPGAARPGPRHHPSERTTTMAKGSHRSAITGRYVTAATAARRPRTTVTEQG